MSASICRIPILYEMIDYCLLAAYQLEPTNVQFSYFNISVLLSLSSGEETSCDCQHHRQRAELHGVAGADYNRE